MTFIFDTTATMKEYNNKKWWIDSDIIRTIHIEAENLKAALKIYQAKAYDIGYVTISDTALRNKTPMYVDTISGETKQVGYVITGSTEFQDDNYKWSKQYIDLWVYVETVIETNFEEV